MASITVLKVSYQKIVRRVPIHPAEWEAAEEELRNAFGNLPEKIALTYVDDENDLITVSSNNELQEAFRVLGEKDSSAFKFTLVELKMATVNANAVSHDEKIQKLKAKLQKFEEKKKQQEEKVKAIEQKKQDKANAKAEKLKQKKEAKEKKEEAKAQIKQAKESCLKELKLVVPAEKFEVVEGKNNAAIDLRNSVLKEIRENSPTLTHVEPIPRPQLQPEPLYPLFNQLKNAIPVEDDVEDDEDDDQLYDNPLVDDEFCFIDPQPVSAPIAIPVPEAKVELKIEESKSKDEDGIVGKLKDLRDMGFFDDEKNLELLWTFNGDMTKVVYFMLNQA